MLPAPTTPLKIEGPKPLLLMPPPNEKKDEKDAKEFKKVQLTKDVSVRVHPDDASVVKKGHKMMSKELKDADREKFQKKHTDQSNLFLDDVHNKLEHKLSLGDGKQRTKSEGIRYWARKMDLDPKKFNNQSKQLKELTNGHYHEVNAMEAEIEKQVIQKYPLVHLHGVRISYEIPDLADKTPQKDQKDQKDQKHGLKTPQVLEFDNGDSDAAIPIDYLGMGVKPEIVDYIAKNGMTNTQIEFLMKDVPGWQCCVARDEGLPIKQKTPQKFWIKNTGDRASGGEHWFAICVTPDTAEYYDSFGRPCPNDVLQQIIRVANPKGSFLENTVAMQNANSNTCGVFSMMFCVRRLTMSFAAATGFKQLKASIKGEKEALEFQKKFKPFQSLEVHGKGIKDWYDRVVAFFKGKRKGAPPSVRKIMEENGGRKITNIVVVRQPVQSYVQKFLNLISLGGFDKAKKELNYDDVFHLSLHVRLDNNQWIKMEKNQVLNFAYQNPKGEAKDQRSINVTKDLDLLKFYDNALKGMGEENFYQYSASKNNCQHFIIGLLKGSGLLTAELQSFILQDVKSIMEKMPGFASGLADRVTDAAAQVDILANGAGAKIKGGNIFDEILELIGLRQKKNIKLSPEMQAKVDKSIREMNRT